MFTALALQLRLLLLLFSPTSALTLWDHDNSLTIAIDVCKAFLEPIEFLIIYFPGPGAYHIFPDFFTSTPLASPAYLSPTVAQQRRLWELQARVRAAEAASRYVSTQTQLP